MVITLHFHTYRALRQRVKERAPAHVSGDSLIHTEHNPPRGAKVNGRAGTCLPVRSDELRKRSPHSFTPCDCLAAKYAESTRP